MCTAAINLTSKALGDVDNAEVLLKIKTFISLFIQTMEVCRSRHQCLSNLNNLCRADLGGIGLGILCFYSRRILAQVVR